MSKKKLFILIGVGAAVVLLLQIILILNLPTIMHNLTTRKTDAPAPEVTYCEFPFEITYKLDGETKTVSDIYVCEYVGSYWNWNIGDYREWKGYLKSNQNENIVLIEDGNKEIICNIGKPEYYMDDSDEWSIETNEPTLIIVEHLDSGGYSSSSLSNELKEYYKIELVGWKLSEPIENSFE